jgi:phage shock protein E
MGLVVLMVLALGMGAAPGCKPNVGAGKTSDNARISGAEAKRLVSEGALLLDVRTPEEHAREHIEGATLFPIQNLSAGMGEIAKLTNNNRGQPIVVHCASGVRSAQAKRILKKAGYTQVHDLGGIGAWPK